jgi:type IV pilus assembly protein PilW
MTKANNKSDQNGITLIELMIAITIGLFMLLVLAALFAESNRSHRALAEASQQIENGRYAIQLMGDDLHMAGYYGQFSDGTSSNFPAVPTTEPDPCAIPTTATLTPYFTSLALHVQGYAAANFSSRASLAAAPLCAAILTNANLQPGSDILVVRRADTKQLDTNDTDTTNNTTTTNLIYLQANSTNGELQFGNSGTTFNTGSTTTPMKADGTTTTILNENGPATGTAARTAAAPIRQYHVHVYFVAPCSVPSDGSTTCTGASDDNGSPIPTLKRLELSLNSSGNLAMNIVPLVEGIEVMKVDYGVDTIGAAAGGPDGTPDGDFLRTPATLANWADVMGLNIYLLSRNTLTTAGETDNKIYTMGVAGTYTPGGNYKRHLYSTTVLLTNPSGRREIP